MWKKGEDIITVNKQVVVPSFKKRFSLNEVENGNELVISLAEEQDAADWTCQVSSFKTLELKHNVQIRGKTMFPFVFWSLTQFYSVDFSQSRIGVIKCVFNKHTIKVCASCC